MKAQNTSVSPFDGDSLREAAKRLCAGEVVAVPTETVYGLAADATNPAAVARIFEAKGRPSFNPLIVHLDFEQAQAHGWFDARALALARAFWPGPLTLVVPRRASSSLVPAVSAGLPTVALRFPAHPVMQALIAVSGRPLAAPSANLSGGVSPTRAEHVLASLGGRIPYILDGGPAECGLESTILAVGAAGVRLLRPGPVTLEQIETVLNPPGSRDSPIAVDRPSASGRAPVEAPGQLASHYAPSKPVRLEADCADAGEWLIGFGGVAGDDNLSESADLDEAAARLFDALHRADSQPRPRIAVAPIPDHGIGLAINDRLRRASAPRDER
ncbi:MAG TPA: L-threonylcarbamoyladenylate synthase [Allosphingosinicella sp.]|jgi:L-threonylcarbamoyladenylate synthase|nr:L-threonylcarbamoyladenylate synthase [Allosphingosinicella sp.]